MREAGKPESRQFSASEIQLSEDYPTVPWRTRVELSRHGRFAEQARCGASLCWLVVALLAVLLGSAACREAETTIGVEGRFYASPLLAETSRGPRVIVASRDGVVTALDPGTGVELWRYAIPVHSEPVGREGFDEEIYLLSTPVVVGDRLVLLYQTQGREDGVRTHHRLQVIELIEGKLDAAFPEIELSARIPASDGSGVVDFRPRNALSRSALAHGRRLGAMLGSIYASFGNQADIQPWHGWVFEVDLDRWLASGAAAAVTATLLITPETHCPIEGRSGSMDMICGGGVWTPAGPQVVPTEDGYELLVPTGNGQLDLSRRDYANSVLRLEPGLDFDPECDAALCRDFDPISPDEGCMASCRNLFIVRQRPGDPPLRPSSGVCDEKTFLECYALIDFDFGANAPVLIEISQGPRVLVQPGKDGHVYLFDADHLGTLYDREKIVEVCGAPGDDCDVNLWRGMIVTRPSVAMVRGMPVVLVPTFMMDETHPAGLVALSVVLDAGGVPRLEPYWQAPRFSDREALERFRSYPSRVAIGPPRANGDRSVWFVDVATRPAQSFWRNPFDAIGRWWTGADRGTLIEVRLSDGRIESRTRLRGRGLRHVLPLLHDGRLYIPSSEFLEIFDIKFAPARVSASGRFSPGPEVAPDAGYARDRENDGLALRGAGMRPSKRAHDPGIGGDRSLTTRVADDESRRRAFRGRPGSLA